MSGHKILIYGFGNPGRLDDGLGPALVERLEQDEKLNADTDANYQLSVEDAATIAEYDAVIFVDAAVKGSEPFYFRRIAAKDQSSFSSHSVSPEGVMGLAVKLFNAKTQAYILGIRGYEFNEFGQKLSKQAQHNLEHARAFVKAVLKSGEFVETGDRE